MRTTLGLLLTLALVGCGEEKEACTIGMACDAEGQFCESYTDAEGMHAACFKGTFLEGQVSDSSSGAPIPGARVVAIDGDSNATVGPVSITDAAGSYKIRVTAPRATAAAKQFTLRVSAAAFHEFPSGIRIALPITVSFADPKAAATIEGPLDVQLQPLAPAPAGAIAGKVIGTQAAGVLVVATGPAGSLSSVTDGEGSYVLFNVPDGTYEVRGYFVGLSIPPVAGVVVAGARRDGVDLQVGGAATGVLTGTLSYVAGADTSRPTAVVLRLPSTREVPPGLSVPAMSSVPYRLEGIPDGTYEVLASFPTDQLVKDPDPGQAGTGTPTATFTGGNTVDVGSFKITNPVDISGPDANQKLTGPVTFTWLAYPQTDHYLVEVFDAQGSLVWMADRVPRSTSLAYGGPALAPGYYQWRITSFAVSQGMGGDRPISRSEDLRGVWQQL